MKIDRIKIQNFKSIRELSLEVRRVNIFIGEPNTGKTNALEALSLLSENVYEKDNLRKVVRFQNLGDLFFDNDISKNIIVSGGEFNLKLQISQGSTHYGGFTCTTLNSKNESVEFSVFGNGEIQKSFPVEFKKGVRRYIFDKIEKFEPLILEYLNPPIGNNLPQVINNRPEIYDSISSILQERGFKLLLRPVENEIHLAKEVRGKLSSYPYQTISETWKRIMFLLAVLETNKDQVLLLDEPEANIFPFFNTQIAETIGVYNTNQFFITTHNPYLLQSLIEKTPKEDLCVFVSRMENFETLIAQLDSEQISEVLDMGASVFTNFDDLLKEPA